MDRSVDPCENFYQYSCGTWIKDNPIPRRSVPLGRLQQADLREPAFPVGPAAAGRQDARRAHAEPSRRSAISSTPAWTKPRWIRPAPRRSSRELRPDRGAEIARAICPPLLAAAAPDALRQQHAFRLRLQSGLRRFHQRDRLRRRGRPGPAGSRLLHQDRREVAGDPRRSMWSTWRACSQLLGDSPATAEADAADRDAHRDRAGQSLAYAGGTARSL